MEAITTLFRMFALLVYVAAAILIGLATMTMAIHPLVGLGTLVFMVFAAHDITKGD